MSTRELINTIQAINGQVIGADIVEYNPHMDNKGLQTGRLVRRTAIAIMTGIAMNAMGMDPEYVNPHHTGELN